MCDFSAILSSSSDKAIYTALLNLICMHIREYIAVLQHNTSRCQLNYS